MKSIRLLPIVIFASLALLIFKGIGLLTDGGYVLTGPQTVVAAEGTTSVDAPPSDPTISDPNATMADTAPTLAGPSSASAAEGAAASSSPANGEGMSPASGATEQSSTASASGASAEAASSSAPAVATAVCPPATAPSASAEAASTSASAAAPAPGVTCASTPMDANGDAVPMIRDDSGKIVPLGAVSGDNSQQALIQRLTERSAALDKREADLKLQEGLLAAAQQKLDESTKQLQDLQAQVAAAVDEKKAAEDANFKAIVSMYETMKPKDAAKIFDTLSLDVLIKVAQAMNPRKMSPILALMSPEPAQALTTSFALNNSPAPGTATASGENLAALPQIVGH